MSKSEKVIQAEIMAYLDGRGIAVWRFPGQAVIKKGRMTRSHLKGFPDLFGICPGREGKLFVIEVKTEKGGFYPEQLEWLELLKNLGVHTIVARSVNDVIEAFYADDC